MVTSLHFLITAGPTIEDIDPVRFLSNRSSGKMGYALAQAACSLGHTVTLISGPTALMPPKACRLISVRSAIEMKEAVLAHFEKANIIIKTAAVADYRPRKRAPHKIKKTSATLTLRLVRNPDILKIIGRKKRKHQLLIGFAAETQKFLKHAQEKIKKKNLDWIVVNNVSQKEIGFESDDNAVTLIHKDGTQKKFGKQSKVKLARQIVKVVLKRVS